MNSTLYDQMAQCLLSPKKAIDLIADGRIHRYAVNGDKAGSRNGWYVLREEGGHQFATFGSWKTGAQHQWHDRQSATITKRERAELHRIKAEALQLAQIEQAKVNEEARAKAARLWQSAGPARADHPYLVKKRVRGYGLRQLGEQLLIPARDAAGVLHTLQFIGADGSKRFLSGGRIKGCYCAIGRPADVLLLAEGFATGSTVHQASGYATAVCFSAGNLVPVARSLRAKFPRLQIIVAADNDETGLRYAHMAAKAVGGVVAVPRFDQGGSHV